jgi:hypothetical protein
MGGDGAWSSSRPEGPGARCGARQISFGRRIPQRADLSRMVCWSLVETRAQSPARNAFCDSVAGQKPSAIGCRRSPVFRPFQDARSAWPKMILSARQDSSCYYAAAARASRARVSR